MEVWNSARKPNVAINGRKSPSSSGYHDHGWGDVPMQTLMHNWYWARAKAGPYTVIASHIALLLGRGELIGSGVVDLVELPTIWQREISGKARWKTKKKCRRRPAAAAPPSRPVQVGLLAELAPVAQRRRRRRSGTPSAPAPPQAPGRFLGPPTPTDKDGDLASLKSERERTTQTPNERQGLGARGPLPAHKPRR